MHPNERAISERLYIIIIQFELKLLIKYFRVYSVAKRSRNSNYKLKKFNQGKSSFVGNLKCCI